MSSFVIVRLLILLGSNYLLCKEIVVSNDLFFQLSQLVLLLIVVSFA